MAKHFKENSKKHFIILILTLCVLFCNAFGISYYIKTSNEDSVKIKKDNIFDLHSHTFSNATYLDSQTFTLTVDDGISTINGSIVNNSAEVVNNLKCLYTLTNASNDVIYTFDISINKIDAHNHSSFTCMAILDLSTVTDYSISLIEQ